MNKYKSLIGYFSKDKIWCWDTIEYLISSMIDGETEDNIYSVTASAINRCQFDDRLDLLQYSYLRL